MLTVVKTTLHTDRKKYNMALKRIFNRTLEQAKELFSQHYEVTNEGCYIWTGGKNNIGYGMWRYDGKMRTAHRCSMMLEGHDVEGKIVYHTCDNYSCVNPTHLRIGTVKDKAQMMTSKGNAGKHWRDPQFHKTCPHCGYHGTPATIGQFHNDRCKSKP